MTRNRPLWLLPISLFALLGCGDDSGGGGGAGGVEVTEPPPVDIIDASAPPPIMVDAGTRAPGDPPVGIVGSCAVDSNKLFSLAENNEAPAIAALSVDRIQSRFGLAYVDASEICLDAVYIAEFKGASGTGDPELFQLIDNCSVIQDVSIAHNESHWLVATVDNRDGASDVWVQGADPRSDTPLPGHRITDDTELLESKVSIATYGADGAIVAWVQAARDGSTYQLMVRPLDSEGSPTADAVEIDSASAATIPAVYSSVIVRAIGVDKILLAYQRLELMSGGKSSIVLRTLERSGVPVRDEWVLTDAAPENAGVDIAAGQGMDSTGVARGGAAVWTEEVSGSGRQIWLQAVGPDGQAARLFSGATDRGPAPKKRLVNAPLRAVDPSITRMPNGVGFAVAYRALVGGSNTEPRIRVLFLDRVGSPIGDSDVAYTGEAGGRTAIQSSLDGRFTVGWNELDEMDMTVTNFVRLPCAG